MSTATHRHLSDCCATGLILVSLVLASPQARSQDTTLAKTKFLDAVAQFEKENYPAALASFEESYRLVPKAKLLYNIGMCERALFRYSDSIATFRRFLAEGGDDVTPEKEKELRAMLPEMEAMVGRLSVSEAPVGATIKLNGKAIGTAPLKGPVFVDPGRHAVEVSCSGYAPLAIEVTVVSGATVPVRAALSKNEAGPAPSASPPLPTDDKTATEPKDELAPPRDKAPSILIGSGIGALVLGAGAAILGGVFAAKYNSAQEDGTDATNRANDATKGTAAHQTALDDRAAAGAAMEDAKPGIYAGFAVGGALLVTGVVLVAVGAKKRRAAEQPVAFTGTLGGLGVSF